MTSGPVTYSSPVSPAGTAAPRASRAVTVIAPIGRPTEPSRSSSSSGSSTQRRPETSVSPYMLKRAMPGSTRRALSMTCSGRWSPELTQNRNGCSRGASSGSTTRTRWAGAPPNPVQPCASISSRRPSPK